MSRNEFTDRIPEGWFNVGLLSNISATEDGQREFLEAIIRFRELEAKGEITEDGFEMPNAGGVVVGRIIDIDYIPDRPIFHAVYSDGLIVVRNTSNNQ